MASEKIENIVIKYFENASTAAGGTFSDEWDADEDYTIKHIFINADGAAPTQSTITIWIDNVAITKDKALCKTFGTNAENALLLNIPLGKDKKFKYSGTNNEGVAKTFTIELVMEKG